MARFKKTMSFTSYNPHIADYWDEELKEISALYVIDGYTQPPTKEYIFTEMLRCLRTGEVFKARVELSVNQLHRLTQIPLQQLSSARVSRLEPIFEKVGLGVWQPVDDERTIWYTERSLEERGSGR